jgi:hypothetical protein
VVPKKSATASYFFDPKFEATNKASIRLQAGLTSTRMNPNGESEEWRDSDSEATAQGTMKE